METNQQAAATINDEFEPDEEHAVPDVELL